MNNNYPDSFYINCAKSVPCDTPGPGCELSNLKNINPKKKLIKKRNVTKEHKINNNKLYKYRINNTISTHCMPYKPIQSLIQSSDIDFPSSNSKKWSNYRSYGNLVIGSSDNSNNIYGKINPWNRIEKLNCPYNTNVDVNMAWNMNNVKVKRS